MLRGELLRMAIYRFAAGALSSTLGAAVCAKADPERPMIAARISTVLSYAKHRSPIRRR